jgi:WD40 repeat protein
VEIKPVERFIDFCASGNWVALLAIDGSFRFRRCDPGTGAWSWLGREGAPNHAAFNLEGKLVAYTFGLGTVPENSLTLSPTSDMGQKQFIQLPGPYGKFAWSPSEMRIAVLVSQPPALALIDVAQRRVGDTIPLGDTPVALAWLADARHVVCSTRREILIIDTTTGELEPFAPALGNVTGLSLDESTHLLATTGTDGRVRVWDLPAKHALYELSLPAERVELSPTGRQLVAYSAGQTHATLWEFASPRDIVHFLRPEDKPLPLSTNAVTGLRFDARGVWLDTGTNGLVQLPAASEVKGVARSRNEAWVHVHLAEAGVQEWDLPRLKERLATLGFGW